MTRRGLPLLLVTVVGWAVGCDVGDKGAVTVRWRIVDNSTGTDYDPRDHSQGNACACTAGEGGGCEPDFSWIVHDVRIVVGDPTTGIEIGGIPESDIVFPCRDREATTRFDIPTGGPWAFSLRAYNASLGTGSAVEGTTPLPTLRQVRKAEIVNLDVIEIAVHPLPVGGVDAGVPDLSPPTVDAGNPM